MATRGHYRTSCKYEGTTFYSCEITKGKLPKKGFILRKVEKVFNRIKFLNACTYHHPRKAQCKSTIYNVGHSSHLKPFFPCNNYSLFKMHNPNVLANSLHSDTEGWLLVKWLWAALAKSSLCRWKPNLSPLTEPLKPPRGAVLKYV